MLACRGIDFSYGQLQVLFDVSFSVDDGEMVALLGTNGAGKSTLLRVISGLGLPSRGSVRFRGGGHHLRRRRAAAEARHHADPRGPRDLPLALRHREPAACSRYTHGQRQEGDRSRHRSDVRRIPAALYQRRDVAAGTLSGGEQQMLGLGKAFILRPQLLLIDELSLGLAPKIVAELLEHGPAHQRPRARPSCSSNNR